MVVNLATISQDVFAALRTLIIANKPTYTYNDTIYTYTMVASQPKQDAVFPCVVLDDSDITDTRITMDAGTGEEMIEVRLDFYALESHGKKAISVGRDGLRNTFIGNISEFVSTDKIVPQEDFWTDSGIANIELDKQVVNTATSFVRFKLG